MTSRRFRAVLGALTMATAALWAPAAFAQALGLPVADTAAPLPEGYFSASAGGVFGEDANLYGARAGWGLTDEFRIFADVGMVDPDGKNGLSLQGGGIYAFKTGAPVDLALRAAGYKTFTRDFDRVGLNTMGIASMEVYFVGWFWYAGAGANFMIKDERKGEGLFSEHDESSVINPSFVLGTSFAVTEQASLFLEVSHVDGFFGAGGIRAQF